MLVGIMTVSALIIGVGATMPYVYLKFLMKQDGVALTEDQQSALLWLSYALSLLLHTLSLSSTTRSLLPIKY